MKNKKRALPLILLSILLAFSLIACGGDKPNPDESDTSVTSGTTSAEPVGESSTSESTSGSEKEPDESTSNDIASESTSESTSEEKPSETDPIIDVEPPAEGLMVFYEDFNKYANNDDTASVLSELKWTKLFKEANGVYSESDVEFAIVDGRLYYDNYDEEALPEGDTRVRGADSYYAIDVLNEEFMKPVVAGKYTLQYDLEYVAAGNNQRYAVVITECSADGQCYNSFHFRIRGKADHQCHFYGSWKTFSAYDPATDLHPAADDPEGKEGTPILQKLLNKDWATYGAEYNFTNVPVTIKLQWDPEMGHHVYMKTADMTDFVKVSEPSVNADGPMYIGWEGWAVQLKIGATIDGYIDNIAIWTGWGDEPADKTINYTNK